MIRRALIAGCGALGNEVIKNLALMGVADFCIVDFDEVEKSNLTRSILFTPDDIGRPKVEVARQAILRINPDAHVRAIRGNICHDVGLGTIRKADIIFSCLDSRWSRYCLQRLCLRAGKVMIDGGILNLEGTVRTFMPGHSCYACSLGEEALEELRKRMPCSGIIRRQEQAGHAPTTPIIASVIGAMMVQEGTRTPPWPKGASYDGETLTMRRIALHAWDEDCPLHDAWEPIETLPEISPESRVGDLRTTIGEGRLLLNEPYVAHIEHVPTGQRIQVGLPAHEVETFISTHPTLRRYPLSQFTQSEEGIISLDGELCHLTLRELGIPPEEVLRVETPHSIRYIEIG